MGRKTVKHLVIGIIIAILIIGAVSAFLPKKIVNEDDYIVGLRVTYRGSEIPADQDEIIKILSKYDAVTSMYEHSPYETREIDFEIDFVDNSKPKYVLLGDFNIWYGRGWFEHNILNAQQLKQELKDTLKLE